VEQFVGLMGLLRELQLQIDPPAVRSEVKPAARRTFESPDEVIEVYPLSYDCKTLQDHLRFALKYEPLDMRVWHRVMNAVPGQVISSWVRSQPNSAYARRAWYLYERLAHKRLPLPDSRAPFADLADPKLQIVWRSRRWAAPYAKRYKIRNNLIGVTGYCPLVRRTKTIKERQQKNYGAAVQELTLALDPLLFERAADYLYRSETKSSYEIEGEKPTADREQRFLSVLERAGTEEISSEQALVRLQNLIVQDERFAAKSWREIQNYVGRTRRFDYSEDVRYVCPKPEDLPALMTGWLQLVQKISSANLSDVVPLAACAAFGFVYLHPFEDGNGRLHRFLIHSILARSGYTPKGIIFPVSAAILRRMKDYENVLEVVSQAVNRAVEYELDDSNRLTVTNETKDLYRFPDLTRHSEFLYECIAETLEKDWPQELNFLQLFDGTMQDIQAVVDLPSNRARLLAKLLLQNQGRLSAGKRPLFQDLTDEEILRMEDFVTARLQGLEPGDGAI